MEEIEAYLKKRPEVTHVTASIGGTPARYNLVRNVANPSLSYGELLLTSPLRMFEITWQEIQQYLSQHYPDAYVKMNRYNLMFKKYPIERSLPVPLNPAVLHQLADSARKIMENCPDVTDYHGLGTANSGTDY